MIVDRMALDRALADLLGAQLDEIYGVAAAVQGLTEGEITVSWQSVAAGLHGGFGAGS